MGGVLPLSHALVAVGEEVARDPADPFASDDDFTSDGSQDGVAEEFWGGPVQFAPRP